MLEPITVDDIDDGAPYLWCDAGTEMVGLDPTPAMYIRLATILPCHIVIRGDCFWIRKNDPPGPYEPSYELFSGVTYETHHLYRSYNYWHHFIDPVPPALDGCLFLDHDSIETARDDYKKFEPVPGERRNPKYFRAQDVVMRWEKSQPYSYGRLRG